MKINILLVSIVSLFACGCVSSKVISIESKGSPNYEKIAISKLESEDLAYITNSDKTYVLCVNDVKGTPQQPRNSLSFVVIKIDNNMVVLEQKIEGGNVGWFKNTEIEVFRIPGIMRDDQTRDDFITLYNVETGNSYPKNKEETH